MVRYTATQAIVLPRMTAAGAKTLGTQLVSAAQPVKKKLPKAVGKALHALEGKHDALSLVLRDLVKPDATGALDPVKCDRIEDACWSGLNACLEAAMKLSWLPIADDAAEIRRIVFDRGLRFIQLPFLLQWSESETRLSRIKQSGLGARIEKLGGKVYLDELEKAHADYGKVLGVTAPLPGASGEDGPVVRAALDAFGDALRKYVVKVMGMVEDDEPESEEMATALLGPIDAWDEAPAGGNAKPAAESSPEPAPEAAGGQGNG